MSKSTDWLTDYADWLTFRPFFGNSYSVFHSLVKHRLQHNKTQTKRAYTKIKKTQRKWQTIACSFTSGNHQRTSKRASYRLSLSLCLIKCIFDFALRKTRKGLTFLVTWKRGFLPFLKNILFLVLHSWLEMKAMVFYSSHEYLDNN